MFPHVFPSVSTISSGDSTVSPQYSPPPFPILDFSINHQLLIARLPAYSFHIESLEFISSYLKKKTAQPAFTCSKLTIETLERFVKYVQS